MKKVYLIWKDYSGGDYAMLGAYDSKEGARSAVKKLFYEAKAKGINPFWTDKTPDREYTKMSFNSDSYEVEIQGVPVNP